MKVRIHYGWGICAVCLLAHFCVCGMTTVGLSVHVQSIRDAFGLSNIQTSMISTVRALSTMVALPFAGPFYRRVSLRMGIFLSCALLSLSYCAMAFADSAVDFYTLAAAMGISYALGATVPITALLRNWFSDRQTLAVAIGLSGSGACAAVISPLSATTIRHLGLFDTFLIESGVLAAFSLLAVIVIRDTPMSTGRVPYQNSAHTEPTPRALEFRGNLSNRETWLLMSAIFLTGGVASPGSAHLAIHYSTVGYTGVSVAAAITLYGGAIILGKFSFGILASRFGTYRVNYIFLLTWIAANFTTAALDGCSGFTLMLSSAMQGIGISIGTVGIAIWMLDLSKESSFLKNIQWSQTAYAIGSLATSLLPGVIADQSGSYSGFYILSGVMMLIFTFIVQSIYCKHQSSLRNDNR